MVTKNIRVRQSARLQRKHLAKRKVIFSILFVGLSCLVILFFSYQNIKLNAKRSDLKERAEQFQASLEDMEHEKEKLAQKETLIQTQEYQEKVLREQGLYKKHGEEVVTVLASDNANGEADSASEEEKRIWWNPFTW
ncbi:MAG: hypothetical protein A2748_00145 [Candidatus Wildermuthbacteria bacterium RIFCSPHIGHO2_01_FULL_45_20]|uniref:Cell division protein FtsL n=1 Tax=Candidatus Wildermuthbacteria bacterium RIFCSPHIGHO2_02_FULL_45_25 TaxID=1802450 RepID=A0A1G2R3E6_9BACT|nr:MAG: hypothetical protein A2748_00145 [Candidatus Wildermuthbacteria bacterium RIFCSPHIGHO2_01_FULL_45_20]OHA67313.1 MAG: hypothetical protein A3C04_01170 [Candidatus Wildermuthbacteria bacterium RIFCSPHIGHO2_02_FULL_45_25]